MTYARKRATIIEGASVKRREYEWLWQDWLLNGKLNLLVGEPAVGKSALMAYMIAAALGYRTWPGTTKRSPKGGYALWVGSEEDAAESLGPQLDALGVPSEHWGQIVEAHDKLHLDVLQTDFKHPLRLVIVDPIIFGHGSDTNRASKARQIAEGWQDLATVRRCCVLASIHTVKHAKTHLEAGSRLEDLAAGSGQFVAVSRMVWLYLRGSDKRGPRILYRAKCSPHIDHKSDGFEVHARRDPKFGMWQPSRFDRKDDALASAREMVRDVGDAQSYAPAPGSAAETILRLVAEHGGSMAAAECKHLVVQDVGTTPRAVDMAAETLIKHDRLRQDSGGNGKQRTWTLPSAELALGDL